MSAEGAPQAEARSVLIVDDDERLADVLERILRREGLAAHSAFSGRDALDWLKHHTAHAILLDLMMPDMSGFGFLRQLRESPATRSVPVIVLTARADHASRVRSEELGIQTFLIKPVESAELIGHIRRALAPGPASA